MKERTLWLSLVPVYALIVFCFLFAAIGGSRAVTVIAENAPVYNRVCVVIDPGHGGEDGGAVSCTGVTESGFNLDIALRLNDLLHLLGIDTVMTRDTDRSIHTQGDTIAVRKVSDLKERGIHALLLEVRVSNTPAITLYEKLGFSQVGRRKNYYHNPKEDALILRKEWEI